MAVYSMMGKESQRAVPAALNPVLQRLGEACRQFQRDATYYDHVETSTFDAAFESLLGNGLTEANVRTFQSALIQLISDAYQVNSYLQESLVNVYRVTEEVAFYSFNPTANTRQRSMAGDLFYQLIQFEHRLEESLQRGPVRYGFLKSRKLRHWDIVVICRYCYSLIWRCPLRCCWFVPIHAETASLLHQFQAVARQKGGRLLSREIRDLETLYWATRESDVASLIFVSASLTFASSLVFTLAWLFSVDAVAKLAFLSAAVSTTGALLAMFHLFRKFFIIVGLLTVLYKKDRVNAAHTIANMGLVQYVTVIQLLLTLARFVTATAATAALALSFLENAYGDKMATPSTLPFWIAMGAFLLSVGSSLFFFVVDFVVRYKLPTELGSFISQLFHQEIMAIHATFVERPKSSITNEHAIATETWEYTARAFLHTYRFDTVFAADRFGQILQFLQSGTMDAHSQH
jgi:hypothetical protein